MKKTNKKIKFVNVEFNNLREATDKLDKMKIKRVYFDWMLLIEDTQSNYEKELIKKYI